jgi:hypothetical protein
MINGIRLQTLLATAKKGRADSLALFALLNLGILKSMANGLLGAADAIPLLYNAENCRYVRKHLRGKITEEIMSRGVQLPDLFDALPAKEAQQEFHRELATMRSLCLKLLEKKQRVA